MSVSPELVGQVEELGVRLFRNRAGEVRRIRDFVPAVIPMSALDRLVQLPGVVRVEAAIGARVNLPENLMMEEIEAIPAWGLPDDQSLPVTGQGVTIGVMDTWLFIFHPDLFKPDAGWFDWVDADGDGLFTPGIDGVDLNGDGTLGDQELLQVLKGDFRWATAAGSLKEENKEGPLVPELDWLFLDTNGNAKRDYGPSNGFTETDPAFGEPVFLVDDVDKDGLLDPEEKIVRLGTSRVRATYDAFNDKLYERGVNLIEAPNAASSWTHASMVVGLAASGAYGFHKIHGIAPDAEIIHVRGISMGEVSQTAGDPTLLGLSWLLEQEPDVTVHSWGSPLEFADGSSPTELAMDELSAKGIITCISAGNSGNKGNHGIALIPAAGEETVVLDGSNSGNISPFTSLIMGIRHREPDLELDYTLILPDGTELHLNEGNTPSLPEGWSVVSYVDISDRGTRMDTLSINVDSGLAAAGAYQWVISNPGDTDVGIDFRIMDQGAYQGQEEMAFIKLDQHLSSQGTVSSPATADTIISVGATHINQALTGDPGAPGDLTDYSSQGPRIDGELGLHVVAPADGMGIFYNKYWPYPSATLGYGTSASAPVVGGAMVLLKQVHPELDYAGARAALEAGSIQDQYTGELPNTAWGYGKLSIYRLIAGEAPAENFPPTLVVDSTRDAPPGLDFELSLEGSSDGEDSADQLRVRVDAGYDGTWDLDQTGLETLVLTAPDEEVVWKVLVELTDTAGLKARAVVVVNVGYPPVVEEVVETGDVVEQADLIEVREVVQPSQDADAPAETDTLGAGDVPVSPDVVENETGKSKGGGCAVGTGEGSRQLLFLIFLALALLRTGRMRFRSPR